MHLEWVSINRTCVSSFMQMYLIALKIITRRPGVQDGMEKDHMPYCCMMKKKLKSWKTCLQFVFPQRKISGTFISQQQTIFNCLPAQGQVNPTILISAISSKSFN